MRLIAAVVVVLIASGTPAHAEATHGELANRGWFGGVNLRTDYGSHRFRITTGLHVGRLAGTVVLDPKVLFDTRANDVDLLTEWSFKPGGWAALGGYRLTQVSIDRGVQFHHEILFGLTAGLPALAGRRIRTRFGIEVELSMARHGDGLDTEWFSVESDRHFRDLVSLNLFLRAEYTSPL
jgi:hypothetical protein